jgi:recombination protein RecA
MARDAAVRFDLLDRYGPGVFTPSEAGTPLSTGYPALDAALGIGGLPRGRIVELTGDDSGKLSLALGVLATATQNGGLAAIIDPARAFYPPSAAAAGVQLANLAVVQPAGLPEALEAIATLLKTEGFTALVYDLPRGGKEPNASQLARLAAAAAHTGTLLLVLSSVGRARAAPSNRPLGYFASVRLLLERLDCRWQAGPAGAPLELAGYRLGVTVIKHKLAAPGMRVELDVSAWEGQGHGSASDRLPLDPALPRLGAAPAATGVGPATADRRRDAG